MLHLRPTKRITVALVAAILIVCGLVSVTVWHHFKHTGAAPETILAHLPEGTNISIGSFRQTASRDGRNEWLLEADAAHYIDRQKKVVLETIAMTFFLDDGRQVDMTAEQGVLETESKDITVSGNVVVTQREVRLQTEQMQYRHAPRLLQTDVAVRIDGGGYDLRADRMTMDIATESVEFEGHVEGRFADAQP